MLLLKSISKILNIEETGRTNGLLNRTKLVWTGWLANESDGGSFLLHWHTGDSLDDERLRLDERRQFERSWGFLELGKI